MRPIGLLACALCAAGVDAAAPPAVDGLLDDPFWMESARVWTTYRPDVPDHAARFLLGWDADRLYFAADVTDPDLDDDDAVQLFLDTGQAGVPDGGSDIREYEFSVTGSAASYRVLGATPDSAERRAPVPDSSFHRAVTLKPGSTLNERGNRDTGYVVEAALPRAELGRGGPLADGRTIGICFINVFGSDGGAAEAGVPSTAPADGKTARTIPRLWQRIRIGPPGPLHLRGLTQSLPLWLGTSMYAEQWRRFASAETDPNGPWFDRDGWKTRLDRMAAMGYNALLLLHPHPYCGLLALEQYPGACHFAPDVLPRYIEQFRWLLAEARIRSIGVYLLTWNICLPPTWAKANGLTEFGADTPLTRAYTRHAVKELFATYPNLAGLATMAAESPPGCIDFVVEAIAGGMNDVRAARASQPAEGRQSPELIFWNWCSYPEDARRVLEAYANTRLMSYLQYEQWFKPMVDPRVPRFAIWAGAGPPNPAAPAVSTLVLGGPKSALAYLFWGDPAWLREVAVDCRRQGTDGIFFETHSAETWLAREAMGYYAANPDAPLDANKWARRQDEVYGTGRYGGQLLEAMQHAGAIVPRFLTLVHSQSDHYMPQFGLPLSHYLEMPTLSSYVFENTQTTDDRGYLTPRLGLTWPNPDWGEHVVGIREEARGTAAPGATLPSDIAREIIAHAGACRSRLAVLKQLQPESGEQARRLDELIARLELNAALGEHFSAKIRAALAWERIQTGQGRADDCLRPLEESVRAWETVSEIAGRLYPRPVRYWQSQIVSPPPWTQNNIWSDYRLVEGHWRDQLPRFRRELDLLQKSLSVPATRAWLPTWDHLDAAPDDNLITLHRITLRNGAQTDRRFKLGAGVSVTADPSLILGDDEALLADTRSLGDGVHEILTTVPQAVELRAGMSYQIALIYRAVDRGGIDTRPYEIGVRPVGGGPPLGEHRFWGAPAGHAGVRILKVPALGAPDYVIYVAIHGRAAVILDQLNIHARKTE